MQEKANITNKLYEGIRLLELVVVNMTEIIEGTFIP